MASRLVFSVLLLVCLSLLLLQVSSQCGEGDYSNSTESSNSSSGQPASCLKCSTAKSNCNKCHFNFTLPGVPVCDECSEGWYLSSSDNQCHPVKPFPGWGIALIVLFIAAAIVGVAIGVWRYMKKEPEDIPNPLPHPDGIREKSVRENDKSRNGYVKEPTRKKKTVHSAYAQHELPEARDSTDHGEYENAIFSDPAQPTRTTSEGQEELERVYVNTDDVRIGFPGGARKSESSKTSAHRSSKDDEESGLYENY